ncbi:helix-turn-helix domain-containing protein [Robiginitomaculum antarcticum]|uniref:helix-turn-helix domain-containing protein n=1 Tax=Robiginitomaculum antarcticum TaxID=437507 RepID=UPI00036CD29E|nr:helix-turn-helix domain-containing protein [Robiginitomaculum antarcticum]
MQNLKTHHSDILRARLAITAVALEFGIIDMPVKRPRGGSSRVSFARQIAMYLTHTVYQINLARVARVYSRDRSTASHACRVVEDCRDDPFMDARISRLEAFLENAPLPAPELDDA